MYMPKHFEITDKNEVFRFIEANAFGQLISSVKGRLFSTHLPFLVSEDRTKLTGHLAKQNPQHSAFGDQEVLITLQGPHDYISPSWYASPGVPTWNYQAVHVYGFCSVFDDAEKLKSVVDSLSNKYESFFQSPWKPEYEASMLGAIVGIEISINEIQCKYKLSQNRSVQDQERIAEHLEALGSGGLSRSMRNNTR